MKTASTTCTWTEIKIGVHAHYDLEKQAKGGLAEVVCWLVWSCSSAKLSASWHPYARKVELGMKNRNDRASAPTTARRGRKREWQGIQLSQLSYLTGEHGICHN